MGIVLVVSETIFKRVGLGDPLAALGKLDSLRTILGKKTLWSQFGCDGSTCLGGVNRHRNVTDRQTQRDIVQIYNRMCFPLWVIQGRPRGVTDTVAVTLLAIQFLMLPLLLLWQGVIVQYSESSALYGLMIIVVVRVREIDCFQCKWLLYLPSDLPFQIFSIGHWNFLAEVHSQALGSISFSTE